MKTGGFGPNPMMRMGGRRPAPPTFRMSGNKAALTNAQQSTNYNKQNSYPASNALKNNNSFTHTRKGVGQWWRASFKGGSQWVWKVRIQNRVDCCGGRLRGIKVMIGNQLCGKIVQPTQKG
jgi:hypothetical protein